ncbi:YidC/Oxa1 family membrane protein insertase [Patescibacteria group bacterium]|nr:YidC/Oxa1 family membrane protein insertase [Patescibacteria group bacterium]
MNSIGQLFNTVILDPIFNVLIFFYNIFGDLGLAVIALTIVVRLILAPLSGKAFKAQRHLQALQPEMKKLQEKHKDDKEALSRELMAFYKREGVNPASSCLPTLVQIPILIALFFVFKDAVTGQHLDAIYSFIQAPTSINPDFLGINLASTGAHPANIALAVITAGLQFVQSRMLLPKDAPAMNRQITYLFPALTFVFALTLPAALPLYWATSTLFMIVQQYLIIRKLPLRKAHTEAVADWNQANPKDVIDQKPKLNSGSEKSTKEEAKPQAKKSGKANVTVRKRGQK